MITAEKFIQAYEQVTQDQQQDLLRCWPSRQHVPPGKRMVEGGYPPPGVILPAGVLKLTQQANHAGEGWSTQLLSGL